MSRRRMGAEFSRVLDNPAPSLRVMKAPLLVRDTLPKLVRDARRTKLGRNYPCNCGSKIKYKKCCMP